MTVIYAVYDTQRITLFAPRLFTRSWHNHVKNVPAKNTYNVY